MRLNSKMVRPVYQRIVRKSPPSLAGRELDVVPTEVVSRRRGTPLLLLSMKKQLVAEDPPMTHRNARLTVHARLEMVLEVENGWTQAEVSRRFRVSRATVQKYVRRYSEQGETGLLDHCSRPHNSPKLTPARIVQKICALRRNRSSSGRQ